MSKRTLFKLQWAYMMNKNGAQIPADEMNFHDFGAGWVYEDREEAEFDRLHFLQNQRNDNEFKYVRVVECEY